MATTSRSYGGVPIEQRRARRRAALLDAAQEIIGTSGFAKLTVSRLCTEAKLSERYYYESFGDLDTVFSEVFDRIVDEIGQAAVTAFVTTPTDIRAKTRAAIAAAIDLIADDPRKARIATVEAQLNPALLMRRAEVMRSFAGIMMAVCADEVGADIVESAGDQAEFAATHLLGGLWETTNSWLTGTLPITRATLIDRSTDQFLLTASHLIGVPLA
ncbi:TetR/AcrR family transcriptional regulator [Nocardia iowensis]|uniref:TetR/AcrR family transcriptional regulator n=1 Tax=Nocardia iowensis TaxID=204891 RepID=A0ABX8RQ22_NOCIO|nr:TetR/AcrR family transcriptional regulator [Nocardia iowensis]QXN91733.1 TetR/AcrR family transcriptional regulator [Nocardia iowensis]